MQRPLSAGKMVMVQSLLSAVTAFRSCVVRLYGGILALERAAETFSLNCSDSVSVAVMKIDCW